MTSINIKNIKIVCFLNIKEEDKFTKLEELVDDQNASIFDKFIEENIYEYTTIGSVNDKLKEQELVKLSPNGIVDKTSNEWKLVLISDDRTASEAIEIMEKYELFSPYTLILYHNLPQGIESELNKQDTKFEKMKCQYFAKGKGLHELYLEAIYPRIIPVIEAILNKDESNFNSSFEDLSCAIMYKDPNFNHLIEHIIQGRTEMVDSWKRDIYEEIFGRN